MGGCGGLLQIATTRSPSLPQTDGPETVGEECVAPRLPYMHARAHSPDARAAARAARWPRALRSRRRCCERYALCSAVPVRALLLRRGVCELDGPFPGGLVEGLSVLHHLGSNICVDRRLRRRGLEQRVDDLACVDDLL